MFAHVVLLRWGEFSTEYVEARLLKQENEESGWMWWSLGKQIDGGPMIAMLPFMLKVTDGQCYWIFRLGYDSFSFFIRKFFLFAQTVGHGHATL